MDWNTYLHKGNNIKLIHKLEITQFILGFCIIINHIFCKYKLSLQQMCVYWNEYFKLSLIFVVLKHANKVKIVGIKSQNITY